jgi:hypothetical protein
MTKEELEKEAEEYANKYVTEGVDELKIKVIKGHWQDGAEFGYNKANEWHYVKDGDLPKHDNDVLVYSGEEWRMCVGRYSPKHKAWEAGCDAIAWKEIVPPELKGE